MKRVHLLPAFVVAAGLLPSCLTIGPDHEVPEVKLSAGWDAFDSSLQATAAPDPLWWTNFEDPVLLGLIDEALAQNLSLEVAALRVLEARVGRRISYQTLLPLPLLGGSVAHLNLSQNVTPDVEVDVPDLPKKKKVKIGGGPLNPAGKTISIPPDISLPEVSIADEIDLYEVGLDAVWELDVWGKKRRGIRASGAEVDAAFATYADTLVRLAGEVAAAYVELRSCEERRAILVRNIEMQRRFLAAAEEKPGTGAAHDVDVQQLLGLLRESESHLPPLEASIRRERNALCLLVGKAPGSLDERLAAPADVPTAPREIAAGIPADLLRRRPDIRRAERLAAAECERIGMAKSELYPQFSLFGSIGWTSSHSHNLFDGESGRGAYGAGVKWNILLYTLFMDLARVHDARYQAALTEYRETVLRAAKEVEDSAAELASGHDRLESLLLAQDAQRRAVDLTAELYGNGALDLGRALDALRDLARVEDDASRVRGSIARDAIRLYKALGGGWETVDPDRIVDDATWDEMDARTDWDWYRPEAPAGTEERP